MGRLVYRTAKERFLLCMSFIYLFAFASLYIQLPGLYGDDGVVPVNLLSLSAPSSLTEFLSDPNLLRLASFAKLDTYLALELCVLTGAIISFVAFCFSSFRVVPVFAALWLFYFSAFKVGQVFLWFQWDLLLLEAGFLAVLLAPAQFFINFPRHVASDGLCMWLIRWLLFRLMFSAGVVKLTSNCPTWWGLKALHWHYQSQCIPTPLAWYAHHWPGWFHSLCVAATLIIEIVLPLLFFVPLRGVRLFSFYGQLLLQMAIILTGNYNFFNLLTIGLCYSLLKDEDFNSHSNRKRAKKAGWGSALLSLAIVGAVLGLSAVWFQIKVNSDYTISSNIAFTREQFAMFISQSVIYTIYAAIGLYFVELLNSVSKALRVRGTLRRLYEFSGVLIVGVIGLCILFSSLVPFASLDKAAATRLPHQTYELHKLLRPYELTHPYGLFRRMTGVNGRPEVVIEGASSEDGPWHEYHFRFKPGQLSRIPPVIIPHQPRLDWQMWFAALGTHENNPWFTNLVYRLLQDEKDVLALMDRSELTSRPRFIRALLYTYHYTDSDKDKNWWRRVKKGEYLPPVSLSSPLLRNAVETSGLVGKRRPRPPDSTHLTAMLSHLRQLIGQPADLSPLLLVCVIGGITMLALARSSSGNY